MSKHTFNWRGHLDLRLMLKEIDYQLTKLNDFIYQSEFEELNPDEKAMIICRIKLLQALNDIDEELMYE